MAGMDIETKVVKTAKVDIKPYVDYSRLLASATINGKNANGGGGFTAGVLGRFNDLSADAALRPPCRRWCAAGALLWLGDAGSV